jgi:hypothetical protein
MIPWDKCSKELQRALLALVLLSASKTATGCVPPMVCDPAPPPSMTPLPPGGSPSGAAATLTPTPTVTPTLTAAPTPGFTPMICDPAPPPSRTPTRTPMICDPPPPPSGRPPKTPMICDPAPAPHSGLLPPAAARAADQAAGGAATAADRLPLAEIRLVRIVAQERNGGAWGFDAAAPWPGADYRWSASGGRLAATDDGVTWQPPEQPGRYLVQVIADWGRAGLAVDAVVLTVDGQGRVTVG